jgi:hypothetical protein
MTLSLSVLGFIVRALSDVLDKLCSGSLDNYTSIASKRTLLRWAAAVLHQLLLTAWDLW